MNVMVFFIMENVQQKEKKEMERLFRCANFSFSDCILPNGWRRFKTPVEIKPDFQLENTRFSGKSHRKWISLVNAIHLKCVTLLLEV